MHVLYASNYIHICLCILIYYICVMFISLPQKWGSWCKSDLADLVHFSLQVVSICRSIGVFFPGIWHIFCVKLDSSWGKNEKLFVRRLEFRDSAGEILLRECSLWWVQSIPDNQLIIFTCLCCKNNCRSCNVGMEKLSLVYATYLLPCTF